MGPFLWDFLVFTGGVRYVMGVVCKGVAGFLRVGVFLIGNSFFKDKIWCSKRGRRSGSLVRAMFGEGVSYFPIPGFVRFRLFMWFF